MTKVTLVLQNHSYRLGLVTCGYQAGADPRKNLTGFQNYIGQQLSSDRDPGFICFGFVIIYSIIFYSWRRGGKSLCCSILYITALY